MTVPMPSIVKKIVGLANYVRHFQSSLGELKLASEEVISSADRIIRLQGELLEKTASLGRTLADQEFKIYSQWGEDGILSFIINSIDVETETFVEFGVESYVEANTRWLIQFRNWRGLVLDGSKENVDRIINSPIFWKHQLSAVAAFITRENINDLLTANGFSGKLGILSIDIDGVDYWVWEAIDCVSPSIVVIEYNSLFGDTATVTVPYRPDFQRAKAHYSSSYYGASLAALELLGKRKGYALIGSNSAGNNAFFVRQDLLRPPLKQITAKEAYVKRGFREARDQKGKLMFPSFEQEQKLISHLPLIDCSK